MSARFSAARLPHGRRSPNRQARLRVIEKIGKESAVHRSLTGVDAVAVDRPKPPQFAEEPVQFLGS